MQTPIKSRDADGMALTYFKRYRMEIDLAGRDLPWPEFPSGYRLWGWNESLLEAHAEAKYLSFRDEIDSHVFPCLGEYDGCCRLMREITSKQGFLPQATWLLVYSDPLTPMFDPNSASPHDDPSENHARSPLTDAPFQTRTHIARGVEYCGTVQGIRDPAGMGAVQNLGITAPHRNHGLGSNLLFQSLQGFREAGLDRVFLEVTAENQGAIRLYERWGFSPVKTVFKAVEAACS